MSSLTRGQIFRRAWPLVFANGAVPLAGVVDTFVLGLTGATEDLGGVALGVALFNVFFMSVYFLRMGTTGLVSQAVGAEDRTETQLVLLRAAALGALLGLVVLLARGPIADLGLRILQGEPAVNAKADLYLTIRALGAPATFTALAISGWLIGTGRMVATLWVMFTFSGVNIVLDLVFVLVLGMGPEGVAAATAIADWAALGVGALLVLRAVRAGGGWEAASLTVRALADAGALRRLFDVNVNLMLRTWMLLAGFTWFVNAGARQGAAPLAGNHVLLQIITLWAFVLDAFAFVAEGEAGRAFGRKSVADLRRAFRLTMEQALAAGAVFAVATWLFGPQVLTALIADPAARDAAIAFLPYCAVVPLLGAPAWILDGVFIGATRGAMLRNAAVFALVVYLAADLALSPPLGNHGVWLAFLIYYVGRAAGLAFYYPRIEARVAEG